MGNEEHHTLETFGFVSEEVPISDLFFSITGTQYISL